MPADHDTLRESLGAYLIDGLESGEAREVRLHLESCESCRDELLALEGLSELLEAAYLSDTPPPPGLEERLMTTVGNLDREAIPLPRREHERQPRAGAWSGLLRGLAAAAIVMVVLGIGISVMNRTAGPPGPTATNDASSPETTYAPIKLAALQGIPQPTGQAASPLPTMRTQPPPQGQVLPRQRAGAWEYELTVAELEPGELYELWLKGPEGHVSAGTFRVISRETTTFTLTSGAKVSRYTEIVITLEPDDGNPQPSQLVVLSGQVTG